jgi:predicted Zn-dependent protease
MMQRAGWDPRQMVVLLETLQREQGRNPGSVEVFLSSHPAPAERVERLRTAVRGTGGGRRDSDEFQRVRRRLRALPPAKPMPR